MRPFLGFLSLVLAFALATWVLGWLAVPAVGFAFGATAARSRAPLESLVAAVAAWLALLGVQAARGGEPIDHVARVLGGIVGVPGWAIVLVSLAFGAALAWSATALGREIRRAIAPPEETFQSRLGRSRVTPGDGSQGAPARASSGVPGGDDRRDGQAREASFRPERAFSSASISSRRSS